jgi:MerR family redox-sensitive transcriptional activator SoxR
MLNPMTIGAVAQRTGVRASAIRFYERSGLLPPARRVSGQRRYDKTVLKQLAVVTLARDAGFTIREIRALFRDFSPDTTAATRWRSIAAGKLEELDAVLCRTTLMRSVVRAMMECRCQSLEDCGEVILRRTECVPLAQPKASTLIRKRPRRASQWLARGDGAATASRKTKLVLSA